MFIKNKTTNESMEVEPTDSVEITENGKTHIHTGRCFEHIYCQGESQFIEVARKEFYFCQKDQ